MRKQPPQTNRPPIAHSDYDELDECGCPLCVDYRETLDEYLHWAKQSETHSEDCYCYICNQRYQAHLAYLAANCRRDTYSELSYLTSNHKLGPQFLRWIFDEIQDQRHRAEGWWAIKAPGVTLQAWMDAWQRLYLPRNVWSVSGLY